MNKQSKQKSLFVGSIPVGTPQNAITSLFKDFGTVIQTTVKAPKKGRDFFSCIIEMSSREECLNILDSQPLYLANSRLAVGFYLYKSQIRKEKFECGKRMVYICNIPIGMTQAEVERHFSRVCAVERCLINKKGTYESAMENYGFLVLSSEVEVDRLLRRNKILVRYNEIEDFIFIKPFNQKISCDKKKKKKSCRKRGQGQMSGRHEVEWRKKNEARGIVPVLDFANEPHKSSPNKLLNFANSKQTKNDYKVQASPMSVEKGGQARQHRFSSSNCNSGELSQKSGKELLGSFPPNRKGLSDRDSMVPATKYSGSNQRTEVGYEASLSQNLGSKSINHKDGYTSNNNHIKFNTSNNNSLEEELGNRSRQFSSRGFSDSPSNSQIYNQTRSKPESADKNMDQNSMGHQKTTKISRFDQISHNKKRGELFKNKGSPMNQHQQKSRKNKSSGSMNKFSYQYQQKFENSEIFPKKNQRNYIQTDSPYAKPAKDEWMSNPYFWAKNSSHQSGSELNCYEMGSFGFKSQPDSSFRGYGNMEFPRTEENHRAQALPNWKHQVRPKNDQRYSQTGHCFNDHQHLMFPKNSEYSLFGKRVSQKRHRRTEDKNMKLEQLIQSFNQNYKGISRVTEDIWRPNTEPRPEYTREKLNHRFGNIALRK